MANMSKSLQQVLHQADQYESKGEKEKARDMLRQGIDLFLSAESGLQEDVRSLLSQVLRWDGDISRLEQVQQLVSRSAQLSIESNYEHRRWTSWGIDKWVNLTCDIHLLNAIATYTHLGMPVDAFRAAWTCLHRHPTETGVIDRYANAIENLLSHLETSGTKLLHRTQDALEKGDFETALQHASSLEKDLFGPIEQEFPDFLAGYDQIDALHIEAEQLKRKIHALSTLRAKVYQPLDSARQAMSSMVRQLQDATDVLQTIPDLTNIPYLAQQIQDLWEQVLKEE